MNIQVKTDNHIEGSEELTRQVEAVVEGALSRFSDRLTLVEVFLTDESGGAKPHGDHMRLRHGGPPRGSPTDYREP